MKLDVAVVAMDVEVVEEGVDVGEVMGRIVGRGWVRGAFVSIVGIVGLLSAGSAVALDGIDLSSPPEAVAEGECPKLIQIKYPFLTCENGQIASSDADELWENTRQIPRGSDFTEGNGYWGDELNRD